MCNDPTTTHSTNYKQLEQRDLEMFFCKCAHLFILILNLSCIFFISKILFISMMMMMNYMYLYNIIKHIIIYNNIFII